MITINNLLIAFFGLMIVVPVLYLVFTSDIIRAAFALVVTLLGLAAMYVLLNAELMAVVQILIYAGGVIVLLIFGIMLTRRIGTDGVFSGHRNVVLGAGLSFVFFAMLVRWIGSSGLQWTASPDQEVDQVRTIGIAFLTDHLVAFEIVAYLLLVALVGAAYLAQKSNNV